MGLADIEAKEIINKNSGSVTTKMENNGKGHKRSAPSDQQGADERKSKKKNMSAESQLRRSLDMCSKHGDVMLALEIYDKLTSDGTSVLNQYNYNILLYLCSSAATGTLKRGKSGNEKLKSECRLTLCKQTSTIINSFFKVCKWVAPRYVCFDIAFPLYRNSCSHLDDNSQHSKCSSILDP